MGDADTSIHSYLSVPAHFADATNHGLFHGYHIIDPGKLKEMDRSSYAKSRDVIKMFYDDRFAIAIIAIESQMNIHYAMPLRCMVYDANTYEQQRREIAQKHREAKDLRGDEWLGRFGKKDRLIPTITLVLYFGYDPWDGALTLHDLLDFPPGWESFRSLACDYQMNLVQVAQIENFDSYSDDLKIVFGFIKYQRDKEALTEYINKYQTLFESVSEENYSTILAVTKSKKILKYKKKRKEGEGYNMCKALEDIKEEGWKIGRYEGLKEGRYEGLKEGRYEGENKKLTELIQKKLAKGQSISQIADALEEVPEVIERLISEMAVKN